MTFILIWNMRNSRIPGKRKGNTTVLFIVDGQTEKWYLKLLKEEEALKNLTIQPELQKKKKISEQYEMVVDNAEYFDKVIWIIDLDTYIKEQNEAKAGYNSKFQELKVYLNKLKSNKKFHVLINTPCLEFWFLLHFKETSRYFNNCTSVCKEFRNTLLDDYQKTEKYYKNRNANIYKKLKPSQSEAINRAERLGDFDLNLPETAKAEIYKIFSLLNLRS
jgi:competence protein ComGC